MKIWRAIDKLSIIWKSDLTDKIKRKFLPGSGRVDTAVWMHYLDANKMAGEEARRQLHKNAASNTEQVLGATSSKKTQLYVHLLFITKTIQVRRTRHAGHCWRSRNELISDVLLWTPTYGRKKKQDDQHEHTYSSYVRIRDVALKTCQRRWTIERSGEKGSGISLLAARHDDDDDDDCKVWSSGRDSVNRAYVKVRLEFMCVIF